MTEIATPSNYTKEYLPGYTGHVPSKNERFGATAGQIKREILLDKGKHPITLQTSPNEKDRWYSSHFVPKIDPNSEIYGNKSRFARNWVCGPNHMIRHQRVPGYTGHIKGLVSENLFSESFGNTTARAVGKVHPIGHEIEPKVRFLSQNSFVYRPTNFRRFIDKPQMIPKKDYIDYSRFINDTFAEEKEQILNKTMENVDASRSISTLRTQSDKPFMFRRKRARN
jgi:hypothetical protein